MDIVDRIIQAAIDAGLDFNSGDVIEVGGDDDNSEILTFRFIEQKNPPVGDIAGKMSHLLGSRFQGVQWRPSENEFNVFFQSAPANDSK